ncbi:GNAT family N-acetyltransferase [Cucumibacter marinus]|uniref:GNAT family N-acetyltransferase n=1 Tax=Cucumibacter marinus TaxID=1121252 RepID=UPI0003F70EE2|nr:GNAT family N-acetyltransferase [Cucumibacter marinus]
MSLTSTTLRKAPELTISSPRIAAHGLTAQFRPAHELSRFAMEIGALNASALDPNPFCQPAILESAIEGLAGAGDVSLLLVHDSRGILRGFAPVLGPRLRRRPPGMLGRGLGAPHFANGMPLVDAGMPLAAEALVEGLTKTGGWRADFVDLSSPTVAALEQAAGHVGAIRFVARERFARPVLTAVAGQTEPSGLSEDQIRDLVEAEDRLVAKYGPIRFERIIEDPQLSAAYEHFLMLEAEGAKGLAGKAVAADPMLSGMLGRLLADQEDGASLVIHKLSAGEHDIALGIGLIAGGRFTAFRQAVDERMKDFMPDLIFARHLTTDLIADERISLADSAEVRPGGPLGSFWGGSVPTGTVMMGPSWRVQAERALTHALHWGTDIARKLKR